MTATRLHLLFALVASFLLAGCGGGGGGGSAPAPGGVSNEAQALQKLAGSYFGSSVGQVTVSLTIAADGSVTDVKNDGKAVNIAGSLRAESLSRESWTASWSDGTAGIFQAIHDGGATYLMYLDPGGALAVLQKGAAVLPLIGFQLSDFAGRLWDGISLHYTNALEASTVAQTTMSVQQNGHYTGQSTDGLQFASEVGGPTQLNDAILGIFSASYTHTKTNQVGVMLAVMSPDKRCVVMMQYDGKVQGFPGFRWTILVPGTV